jgi:hypothetical protein
MFANLLLLPSLLLSFEKFITTKSFKEPMMELIDEEDDIELEKLKVQFGITPGKGEESHEDLVKRRKLDS